MQPRRKDIDKELTVNFNHCFQTLVAQAAQGGNSGNSIPPYMLLIPAALLLLFFMSTKSSKKQRAERENLLKNLKRGDRIQTIGGMLATVIDVDKDEILLKIDETNNTKAKFLRSAIHTVIVDKKSSDQAK
jgi:preprotein translocase subunit YajC